MTYTLKRIGFVSAVKIAAIVSAAVAVLPIVIFLLLNAIFKFWDIEIPPDLQSVPCWHRLPSGPLPAAPSPLAIVVVIYNICAHYFGGITFEVNGPASPAQAERRSRNRLACLSRFDD